MSAFMGGVASGFLQAKIRSEDAAAEAEKQRLATLEREKDRQVRRDIAADQLEMNRLQLQQARDSARKRDNTQIANASFTLLRQLAKTNTEINLSEYFTPQQTNAMYESGLIATKNVFDASSLHQHHTALERKKLVAKQVGNFGTTTMHPSAIVDETYKQVAKNTGKTTAEVIANYTAAFEKKEFNKGFNFFKEAHPKRLPYTYKNEAGVTTFKPMPLTGLEAMINNSTILAFKGLNKAPDKEQYVVLNNPDNVTAIKFTELENAEHALKILDDDSADKKGLIKKLKQTYASKFKDVNRSFINSKGSITAVNANGDKSFSRYHSSFEKIFPELFKIFKGSENIVTGGASPKALTIDEKAQEDVNDGIAKNTTEAIVHRQNGTVQEESADSILKQSGLVLGSPRRKPGEQPPEAPTVKTVKNRPIDKIVPTTNTSRLTPAPKKYRTPEGNEKFVISFEDGSLNTEKIDALLSYNDLKKSDPTYFDRNPSAAAEYDRLKGIFKPLSAVIDNPDSAEARANLKNKVVELFDIKRTDGRVDPKALDAAVNKIVEAEYFDRGSSSPTFSSVNGVTVLTTYNLPGETEDNFRKPKQKLLDEGRKLDSVTDMTASYSDNINYISLISQIIDKEEFTPQHAQLFEAMANGVDVTERLRTSLGMSVKEMESLGYKIATDATTNTTRVIERFKDFFTAFQVAAQNLGSTVNGIRVRDSDGKDITLKADNFQSRGSDSINDQFTRSRLKEVERAAAVYSRKYSTNIQNALTKAEAAKNNKNYKEYFKQKLIAFRNNLLARNAMQKVTLTYTFAGMVQGESGGRAISNEDFAILYQAIWSKTGNDMGQGSFTQLQNVIKGIKERNSMMQKYIELKDGPEIANFMVRLNRGLAQDNLKDLYLSAKTFRLSDRLTDLREGPSSSSMHLDIPSNIITHIYTGADSSTDSPVAGLNSISKKERGQIFTKDVVNPILASMPKPVMGKSRLTPQAQAYAAGKVELTPNKLVRFRDLDDDAKSNITQGAIRSLLSNIYENKITPEGTESNIRTLNSNAVTLMNIYTNLSGNRELKLGDALINIQTLKNAKKESVNVSESIENKGNDSIAFIENLVEYIYDATAQRRYSESNPTKEKQ